MSSAASKINEQLPAEESKGYFELGTQPLFEHFTEVAACKTPEELSNLLKKYLQRTISDLEEQEQVMMGRLLSIDSVTSDPSADKTIFEQQKSESIKRLTMELDASHAQLEFIQDQAKAANAMTEQDYSGYKADAESFLTARQKVLDSWDENYSISPLMIVDDIDDETIAIPVDGSDIGDWIDALINKSGV